MVIKISSIFSIILFIILGVLFIKLGLYIRNEGKPITDFCHEHYRNETFLDTLHQEGDTWNLPACSSESFRYKWKYGISICNSTCQESYQNCMEENATDEQIEFINKCHWMGLDYLISAGTIFCMAIGIGQFIMAFAVFISMFKNHTFNIIHLFHKLHVLFALIQEKHF